MKKKFNITGTCIPEKHYMVDVGNKLARIEKMVENGEYFTINRPRQYGKTTTMFLLEKKIQDDYLVIRTSFEGIGDSIFYDEAVFSSRILGILARELADKEYSDYLGLLGRGLTNLDGVSDAITKFVQKVDKPVVLMIDEVDKSSNNQLFVSFIGILRNKYLKRSEGKDYTFQSVILAGVHDVKNLKLKLRSEEEKKYNSPWNIAVDFNVDMSFSSAEIATMLEVYVKEAGVEINVTAISELLYYYTSGYPFLVSRLCKIVDEDILGERGNKCWDAEDISEAIKKILKESNTNFDSLIINLENNEELYDLVFELIIEAGEITYNHHNPLINLGGIYGVFRENNGKLKIHNRIYEQIIYNYMSSKLETSTDMGSYNFSGSFFKIDGRLDFHKVLLKFQEFMKKEYSRKDEAFVERNGRLLFLAFIRPVINGRGFDFKEVQVSLERRLDIVVTYLDECHVVELKVWRGDKAHEDGLKQLCGYLESLGRNKGYLVIYDSRKSTQYEWKQESIAVNGKNIFAVWV